MNKYGSYVFWGSVVPFGNPKALADPGWGFRHAQDYPGVCIPASTHDVALTPLSANSGSTHIKEAWITWLA